MHKKLFNSFLIITLCFSSINLFANALPNFKPLVEKNSAAVVNISTTIKSSGGISPGLNMPDIPENSPFYEFFKKYFGDVPPGHGPSQERSSLGSGFIISKDGYVITNHHVVKDADEIIVRLNDRSEFVAELVGSDARSDIAVLKLDGKNLPHLKFGDSDKVTVGEWVLAIGSPFGFDYSVTAGIISAIGRSLPNENYVPFIQTDVAINPGNSGGPLFNLDGEVIGVNSQIYSRTGGFMGLSFAVPVNVVENVYLQLKEKGRVSRGWLGVLIQDVTRELAESFDMDHPHGALIAKVIPDGPAEQGGIEVGDIIVKFNGKKVTFSSDLPPLVGSTSIGSTVRVDIIRRSKSKIIEVEILELPTDNEVAAKNSGEKSKLLKNPLNIVAKDLTDKQKQDIDIYDHGIIVEQISVGPAQKSGIRRGDIILLLDNIKVKNIEHFNKLVKELPKDRSISVLIQRRDGPVFLAMKLE
ncbi:MAG: serine peptidase [Legionellales bacterium]|nr:serine peptidase [Legionellales bacterium]|tara:strand:- start:1438 stop:2847 length:1410 start_codon:yes stop_codon:yes gene_type:complete